LVDTAHDTTPSLVGIEQFPGGINIGCIIVIWAPFFWIVGKIKGNQLVLSEIRRTLRKDLLLGNRPNPGIRQFFEVFNGIIWISSFLENRLNIIPGELGPVLSIFQVIEQICFREKNIPIAVRSAFWR
jgi:hypothetical protein